MIRFAKYILRPGLNGLALALLALSATAAQTVIQPARLPLYFEANQGQNPVPAQFIARGQDYQFLISPAEAQIVLRKNAAETTVVRMQFTGASLRAQIRGDAELPGKINYLTGSDPAQWHTGIATFARVQVEGLYPGINLVYYGNQQQLEYDFVVAPGADPVALAIHFDGVDTISINDRGELVLSLAGGEIRQPKPVIYQTLGGTRKEIAGGYRLLDPHTVAFTLGEYDRHQPLIIDPVLNYSTYFGGTAGETALAVARDSNGSIYMTGQILSSIYMNTFPFSTAGAFQTNFAGGKLTGDAFVGKFNASGSLVYETYLGGSADDEALGIATDAAGDAYVTGFTDSTDFPTTNALYKTISGKLNINVGFYPVDAFVAELDPSGSSLIYSTYLGGSQADSAYGIAVDATGNAYVTGFTASTNFPTTNAIQKHLACTNSFYFNANAFVAKIGPGGSPLVYSTYFGGTNYDQGKGIAVDSNGFVYVTGFTASTNFPTTNWIQQVIGNTMVDGHLLNRSTNRTSSFDAFVSKFDPTGTNLVYSTLLGSTNNDVANAIAVDNTGAAYVTGWSVSTNFPNTLTNVAGLYSFIATNTRFADFATNVFLTKITNAIGTTNTGIAWSTLFGGRGADVGNAVAVDPAGEVFVAGSASSTNFPLFNVPSLMRGTNSGKSDAFVIAFNTNATALLYSTYLGGKENDYGYGIAVDTNGNAFVVGQTLSTNFPILNGEFTSRNGSNDAFLASITLPVPLTVITNGPDSQTIGVGSNVTFTVLATGMSPFFYQWQKDGTNLVDGGPTNGPIITGATNSNVLTIANVQTNNAGKYSLIITNYGGSATSSNAILTVALFPPVIETQPVTNLMVGAGTVGAFAVTVIGSPPLSYQWQLDGTNLVNGGSKNGPVISGATNSMLTITNVQLTNMGNYSVIVTNLVGSTNSSNGFLQVVLAPQITVQPATNLSISVGSTANFAVTAVGMVPLSYHWRLNGTNLVNGGHISGATSNLLTISNAQRTNGGIYTVAITNQIGSVTSSNANLTVTNIPVIITTQPASQTNGVGTTATLTVTVNANATPPLSYHWRFNGTNLVNGGRISGATNAVLTITTVQLTNMGNYSVIVTNAENSATSSNAFLTVQSLPEIRVQPATNQTLAVGSTVTLGVTAIGMVPLNYQWRVNGTNLMNGGPISGATNTVLTINNAQTNNSGTYTVVVTNLAGSVTSSNAFVTVTNIPVTITTQPAGQTNGVGATVTLTVAVSSSSTLPLKYQWQVDGTDLVNGGPTNGPIISGVTANVLIIRLAQTNNTGTYTVIVSNPAGPVTSSNAFVMVTSPPLITMQPTPTNQSMAVGSTATFAVTAVGMAPLSYQWQINGTDLVNGTNLVNGDITSGATTNVLTINNAQTNNSGTYTVIITNSAGLATSSNANLTVTNIPVTITTQPASQTNGVGTTLTLTVTVNANATRLLNYQWQIDGTDLVNGTNLVNGDITSGATTNVLTINNAQTNNSGTYTVIVSNPAGPVTSSNAFVMVTMAPIILVQPATNQLVAAGSAATLTVTAVGMAPLSYQWQINGTNLVDGTNLVAGDITSGATTNVLAINNVSTNNSGIYTVIVTNLAGSVTSSNANLTVVAAPLITLQPTPTNQSMAVGSTATFVVTAIGLAPLSYQWQVNGMNLVDGTNLVAGDITSGANTHVLTINNAQTNNSGTYTVIITNSVGSVTSSNAILTVTNFATVLTLQPADQTVAAGSTVTFSIDGNAQTPFFLQWVKDGTDLVDGGRISGATNATLVINNAQTVDDGTYWIVVTTPWGSLASSNAVLTVISPLHFGSAIVTGDGFILSGGGGVTNGTYYVLASSNLLVPLTNWTSIATDSFDNNGNFIFTNASATNAPQQFYRLQLP